MKMTRMTFIIGLWMVGSAQAQPLVGDWLLFNSKITDTNGKITLFQSRMELTAYDPALDEFTLHIRNTELTSGEVFEMDQLYKRSELPSDESVALILRHCEDPGINGHLENFVIGGKKVHL